MGIGALALGFIHESIYKSGHDMNFHGQEMCELGDQSMHFNIKMIMKERPQTKQEERPLAKQYFQRLGFRHTSIDIHGKRGSVQLDLSKPVTDKRYLNRFDILTNLGFTEHVDNQFECWKNMHNMLKSGGIFIHISPVTFREESDNGFKRHCNYCYYPSFFANLAKSNSYYCRYMNELYELGSIGYCYEKYFSNEFQSTKEEIDSWVKT